MEKYHWELKNGKRRLIFDPLPQDSLSDDIPWEAVKQAICTLTGYGFTTLKRADIEDAARVDLSDNWGKVKKCLLAAGAKAEGKYLIIDAGFVYNDIGKVVSDA